MYLPKIILTVLFLLILNNSYAQPQTNLDIIYTLIEQNIKKIENKLPPGSQTVILEYNSPGQFQSFENRVIYHLKTLNILKENPENEENALTLRYSLDQIGVLYSDVFRDGLLGSYQVERKVFLTGVYALGSGQRVIKTEIFEESYTDTVSYSDIKNVETANLPVTRGNKPEEPLFQSSFLRLEVNNAKSSSLRTERI